MKPADEIEPPTDERLAAMAENADDLAQYSSHPDGVVDSMDELRAMIRELQRHRELYAAMNKLKNG